MNVDQFYGIEINPFSDPHCRDRVVDDDHIMNNRLSLEFGQTFVRIPLTTSPHILNADALDTDWDSLLPPEDCSYVFGNPPFGGQSYQSKEQREQMRRLTNPHGRTAAPLDYVGSMVPEAGAYVTDKDAHWVCVYELNHAGRSRWPCCGRASSTSTSWKLTSRTAPSPGFGYTRQAHVHVVILGLNRQENARTEKRLFSYPDLNDEPEESRHAALSPYPL